MQIMFINDSKSKYRGRLSGEVRELPVTPIYEYPVAYPHGIYLEMYENIGYGLSPYRMLAVYRGIRRSHELPRRFDPARLV